MAVTITIPLVASEDDAWAALSTGRQLAANIIQWGYHPSSYPLRSFLRFPINLPKGTIIASAYLRLYSRYGTPTSPDSSNFTPNLAMLDYANCPNFSTTNFVNTSLLWNAPTKMSIPWHQGPQNLNQLINGESPNIASMIQDFINNPSYAEGNYVGLRLDEGDATTPNLHQAWSFDAAVDPALKPQLEISYISGVLRYLTINSRTGGITDPPAGIYPVDEGTPITITATRDSGYLFSHFEVDGINTTDNPITIIMDADHIVNPIFVLAPPPTFPVTIQTLDSANQPIIIPVLVDSEPSGNSPLTVSLAPGTHRVTVPAKVTN